MSYDLNVFETYKPLGTSKRITIANGNSIPMTGQGRVTLSLVLPTKQVLHIPNLSTNLIYVHQLTKDLNCRVIFSPHTGEFQALEMEKMIGAAEEQNGLLT